MFTNPFGPENCWESPSVGPQCQRALTDAFRICWDELVGWEAWPQERFSKCIHWFLVGVFFGLIPFLVLLQLVGCYLVYRRGQTSTISTKTKGGENRSGTPPGNSDRVSVDLERLRAATSLHPAPPVTSDFSDSAPPSRRRRVTQPDAATTNNNDDHFGGAPSPSRVKISHGRL